MKNNFLILIVFLSFPSILSAEESAYFGRSNSQEFMEIKEKTGGFVQENQKLEAEHELLRKELVQLQMRLDQESKQMNQLVAESWDQKEQKSFEKDDFNDLQESLEDLEHKKIVSEAKNIYLVGEVMDADEELRVWKLHFSDLQYEKRALELEYKLKKYGSNEDQRMNSGELDQLRQDIIHNSEREQEINSKIIELQDKSGSFSQKIDDLSLSNEDLEKQVISIRNQLALAQKETQLLKNKRLLVQKSADRSNFKQQYLKDELEADVKGLEEEYAALNEQVAISLNNQEESRKLLNDMVSLDRSNQELRQNIVDLQEKIKILQQK